LESFDKVEDVDSTVENYSDSLFVPCSENSGSKDTFAEGSDETNAVPTEEGGEINEEEQQEARDLSENGVTARAIRRRFRFAQTLQKL
jgi:hypothetical protein